MLRIVKAFLFLVKLTLLFPEINPKYAFDQWLRPCILNHAIIQLLGSQMPEKLVLNPVSLIHRNAELCLAHEKPISLAFGPPVEVQMPNPI